MNDYFYQGILEGLQEVLLHTRGEIELPSRTYEHTFPDCPPCWNIQDNDCRHRDQCIVQISEDGERVGKPSKYISLDEGRIIDEFNDIGLVNPISPENLRKMMNRNRDDLQNE